MAILVVQTDYGRQIDLTDMVVVSTHHPVFGPMDEKIIIENASYHFGDIPHFVLDPELDELPVADRVLLPPVTCIGRFESDRRIPAEGQGLRSAGVYIWYQDDLSEPISASMRGNIETLPWIGEREDWEEWASASRLMKPYRHVHRLSLATVKKFHRRR